MFVNDIVLNPIQNTDRGFRVNAKHLDTDSLHFVLLFAQWGVGLASKFDGFAQVIVAQFSAKLDACKANSVLALLPEATLVGISNMQTAY